MGMGFNGSLLSIIVAFSFIFVFGLILFTVMRGVAQWNKNNQSPVLTVEAQVMTKRTAMHHHHNAVTNDAIQHHAMSTTYFVTFEVSSGDRLEFHVSDSEFGMLVEGDRGNLTFQGTRYQQFERFKVEP